MSLKLNLLQPTLAVCRLAADAPDPDWVRSNEGLTAVIRTRDELSIICSQTDVPAGVQHEGGWRALGVVGPLDFSLVGILASLALPLRDAGISIFSISTFDTDYLLVKEETLVKTIQTLQQAGFLVLE